MVTWPIEPILTDRLTIRDARSSDASLFERLYSDPEVRAYLGGPVADSDIPKRVAETPWRGVFTVEVTQTGEPIGLVHIGPYRTGEIELSYEFVPEVWGRGIAREACGPVLAWALREVTNGEPVIAVTQAGNDRSVALLRSLGMTERERFEEFGAEQVLMSTIPPQLD
jgi:RimJ/RimL family protein N-acetyltransferase